MIDWLNIKKWIIIYDDFHYSEKLSIEEQYLQLKEDLLQIEYWSYIIDVGRYWPWNDEWNFNIFVIYNKNRDNPYKKIICKTYDKLINNLKKIVQEFESN